MRDGLSWRMCRYGLIGPRLLLAWLGLLRRRR